MKHCFKSIILTLLILIVVLAFPQSLKSQQLTGVFIMSSVGSLENMYSNSMAVSFNSSASCLKVQNGTAVLTGDIGSGTFSVNCEVNIKMNTLGIKLYPNPVIANTKVKFIHIPPLNDLFTISI